MPASIVRICKSTLQQTSPIGHTKNNLYVQHSGIYHSGIYHSGIYHSGIYHSGIYHSGIYHSVLIQLGIQLVIELVILIPSVS